MDVKFSRKIIYFWGILIIKTTGPVSIVNYFQNISTKNWSGESKHWDSHNGVLKNTTVKGVEFFTVIIDETEY